MKKKIALIALVLFSVATFMPAVASVDLDPDKKKTTVVVEKESAEKSGCNGCASKCGDAAKKAPCNSEKSAKAEPCKSEKKAEATPCSSKKSSCCGSKTKKQ